MKNEEIKLGLPQLMIKHQEYKNILELAAYIVRFKTAEMEKAFAQLILKDLYPPMIAKFSNKRKIDTIINNAETGIKISEEVMREKIEAFISETENQEVSSKNEHKAILLLKELWKVFNQCPEINAYFNGYAQALEDGAQTPLTEDDLGICIKMQKAEIIRLKKENKELAEYKFMYESCSK